jgi:hypothetical protein
MIYTFERREVLRATIESKTRSLANIQIPRFGIACFEIDTGSGEPQREQESAYAKFAARQKGQFIGAHTSADRDAGPKSGDYPASQLQNFSCGKQ